MKFGDPIAFLLIPLILVLSFIWNQKAKLPSINLQVFGWKVAKTSRISISWIQTFLKVSALLLCVFALARPQTLSRSQERKANGIDIMMVLDVSLSMLIQDMGPNTRMEIAKKTFKAFIEGRQNDRIGLVIFSGEPITLAPPTLDYGLLISQMGTVEPGGPGLRDGTAIGDGLALSINRLKKSSAKSRIIILLTDGDNNVGRIDPITAGELAQGYGIKVYSIAIGTEGRVKQPLPVETPMGRSYTHVWVENRLNPTLLSQISSKTNGRFYRVQDESALQQVFRDIDQLEKTEITTKDKVHYNEEFIPFAYAGLFLFLLERMMSLIFWRQWA
ncbi:MAG: VWA domain-containing protein [Bdellovibrionales bacterium]|nr:VWA domain-containing protein [Bdellovibrionales bacterium]